MFSLCPMDPLTFRTSVVVYIPLFVRCWGPVELIDNIFLIGWKSVSLVTYVYIWFIAL